MPSDWDEELAARCSEASYEDAAERLGIYAFLAHDVLELVDREYPIDRAVDDTLDALRELADELGVTFYAWDDWSHQDDIDFDLQAASKFLFECGLDALETLNVYDRHKEDIRA